MWPCNRNLSLLELRIGRPATAALLVAFCSLVVAGCGGGEGATNGDLVLRSGKVTVGGDEIDSGRVEFIPKPGFVAPVVACPIKNGNYAITKENEALPGPYIVTIRGVSKTGETKEHPDYLNCSIPVMKPIVAPKYMSNAETPLSAELTIGEAKLDFPLPALTEKDIADLAAIEEEKRKQEEMQSGG